MKKTIKIEDYYYNHDCGCCTDWGTILTIDGEENPNHFASVEDALKHVLTTLGYEIEHIYTGDEFDDEE